jgi:thiosulfate/3-mercaptopyruvate sulfurtransferase
MTPLVTASWLAEQLNDPNTVVLDATLAPPGANPAVDPHASYLAEHIPGALYFDIEALSDHSTSLPHMLPTSEAFAEAMTALGVGSEMRIVVYEQQGVFSAPRAWWMLRTFGAKDVYVLDGGLSAWLKTGLPTTKLSSRPEAASFAAVAERPASPAATFHAILDPTAVVDFPALQQQLAQHAQVLDARSAARFQGTAPEPRAGLPSGHMPGATSLPFTTLVEDGRLKPASDLREIFAAAGVDLDQPITTTCGSGVTAAVVLLALQLAGAPRLSLYDGSWAEYAQHPNAVIVTSGS